MPEMDHLSNRKISVLKYEKCQCSKLNQKPTFPFNNFSTGSLIGLITVELPSLNLSTVLPDLGSRTCGLVMVFKTGCAPS